MLRAALFLILVVISCDAAAQGLVLADASQLVTKQELAAQSMVAQQDVTLDASGNATWDYSALAFPKVPAVVHLPAAMDTTNPITCNYTARTATAVSIHCWRTSLLGLLTNLYSGSVAGAKVTLIARAIP